MNKEPVAIIAAITAFLISVIDFLVLLDWWNASPEQIAGAHLLIGNAAILVGAVLARNAVTPLADPMDNDGNVLVPYGSPASEFGE